ncbi:MAG TPA: carboxypeptidase regulatory-like domain-containing protein, partial [Candidatus Angelobacter sp.]
VLACLMMCLLLASGIVLAQGTGASGDITGTVIDPSGAVLPNATVTATDVARGVKRSTTSDSSGHYEITGLLPAVYEVSAGHSGFQNLVQKGVVVSVGQTTNLDFHMKVAGGSESVEVTTEPPAVDTERGHQADTINQQLIQDLPINRRDYLTFTLLAPGVSDSTRMANDQDFRVKQTPQSGLSFYGGNGRGNSVTVDGGEANDDSGGVRLTLSQDAVQEFQINRSNYGADLGGASGASINIVSKSGSNDLHGSAYGFFRNDALDAANPFAFTQALGPGQVFTPFGAGGAPTPDLQGTPTKDTLTREQFGGSFGFPISRDKTFGFVSAEGLIQNAQNAVPLVTNTGVFRPDTGKFSGNNQVGIINGLAARGGASVPCLSHTNAPPTFLPANVCAGILQNVLTVNPATSPLSAFLVNQFENNGGLFKYDTREYFISGRLDHVFSDSNQAYLRYSFAHDNEQNPDVQSLVGFSAGSSIHAYDNTAQAAWFHQFSAKTQNELRGQFNYTGFNVIPNTPGEVGLAIPGFANLGTNIFLPSLTIMRRPDIADNMTMIRGHHTMKFGGEFLYRGNHTESHTFFPGRFVFGNLPGGLLSPCLQVPAACGLPAGTLPAAINGLQSASLGLPQFYQQGFGNPIYNYPRPFTSAYWQDQWAITPNFNLTFGVRYELDSQYGALNSDKDNFAPRASFVWDPFGDHKVAIRGGVGIFYSPIYGQIADVVQTLGFVNNTRPIAQVFVPLTGAPGHPGLNSAVIFQTLFAEGLIQCTAGNPACITTANLTQFGINVTNTGPPPPLSVVFSGQPDYQSPYSEQASFGIEGEVAKGFSVSLSGIYVHTLRLPVALDINDLPAPFTTATSPFTGQQVKFQNWAAQQCGANPFLCFVNPLILQADQYSSKGSSVYEGAIVEVQKRFSQHVSLLANYTFSKAIDTTTDFNSDFGPQNSLNLAGERGLSSFDQRHKIVIASVLETPWKGQVLGGWQFAPVFKFNSGHPINILAGGTDINGDRHSTNDRPLGIGRNTGLGPNYYDFDMRLTKAFKMGERAQLQFIAEGFNIFNHTNFASVNNEVPTLGGFTNVAPNAKGFFVNPAVVSPGGAPLAFTSAQAKRQLQLGARLVF